MNGGESLDADDRLESAVRALFEQNRIDEAFDTMRRAVRTSREQDWPDSREFRWRLAKWLSLLGGLLVGDGRAKDRAQEALQYLNEAVGIWRSLAADKTDGADRALASALADLGNAYRVVGHRRRAFRTLVECVAITRTLEAGHDLSNTNLATRLVKLARAAEDLKLWQQAAAASEEAIASLLEARPMDRRRMRDDLPSAVGTFVNSLERLGAPDRAIGPTAAAIEVYRQLAEPAPSEPESALPDLLVHYARCLIASGHPKDALDAGREATEIYRHLSMLTKVSNSACARSRFHEAHALIELGRGEEALPPAQEAVEFYRDNVGPIEQMPRKSTPVLRNYVDLAGALHLLGVVLGQHLNDTAPARDALAEALPIFEHAAAADHVVYGGTLAAGLMLLADILARDGNWKAAAYTCRRAVSLYREHRARSVAADEGLAITLANLSVYEFRLGNRVRALALSGEAVETYVDIIQRHPALFRPRKALRLHRNHEFVSQRVFRSPDPGSERWMEAAASLAKLIHTA
jgi:tetratricopeptide (TPR) repeat protein